MSKIRVAIVEDDRDWLKLISGLISKQEDMLTIGMARDKEQAIMLFQEADTDIILMDINLSGNKMDGIYAAAEIHQFSSAKIIMLTSLDEEDIIINSFAAGAVNYVSKKQYMDIPNVIRSSYHSTSPYEVLVKDYIRIREEEQIGGLTTAEREIFKLLDEGMSQSAIAKKMYISESTLKKHVNKILKKLGVTSSKEAVKKIRMRGLFDKDK